MKSQERMKFWQRHVTACSSFKGSIGQYCERENISLSSFYQWRRELAIASSTLNPSTQPLPSAVCKAPANFAAVEIVKAQSLKRRSCSVDKIPDPRWVATFVLELHKGLAGLKS